MNTELLEKIQSVEETVYQRVGKYPDFLCLTGSRLYGTNHGGSDWDIRGFVIPPAATLLGRKPFEQVEIKDPDAVVWSLPKFVHLLEIGSPNVVELLWSNPIVLSTAGAKLLKSTDLFVSKHLAKPIFGFAKSEWLKCERSYGDTGTFDSKGAYHAVRLLLQLKHLLIYGSMKFPSDDSEMLLAIKEGRWKFETIKNLYNQCLNEANRWMDESCSRNQIEKSEIDRLYFDMIAPTINQFFKDSQRCERCQPF
jgi:predicted nucleotidyltransferase